jgi:hypothetical protein
MPDGDRFERSLHGRGWRKAYRMACNNEPFTLLGDALMTAVAAALRGPLACASLPLVRDAVCNALQEKALSRQLNFGDRPLADPYKLLADALAQILATDSNALPTQLAAKAAQTVYLEHHLQRTPATSEQVQNRLAELFVEWVVRHQCLARVREPVAEKCGRTAEAQMAYEENLFIHLAGPSRKMLAPVFRSDGASTVRAPRRSTPQRRMTLDELGQGIPVLEV